VGEVDPRLFGSFVEHLGRCVYTGIYEARPPRRDAEGLRQDVLDLVRELGTTAIRYPGGNFVSGYKWETASAPGTSGRAASTWRGVDGDEPLRAERVHRLPPQGRRRAPARREPGHARRPGGPGAPGVRQPPGGTALSDLRVSHGDKDPFGIRLWCLGNEVDGDWQTGHKTAEEYGRLAAETARACASRTGGRT